MIQIDEMVLRVPGMPEEQASLLGREVAQLVASAMPADIGNYNVPELQVKINESSFSPGVSMAAAIAEQIVREIKLSIYK
jgi:hypothetical protein